MSDAARSKPKPVGLECPRCGCRHWFVVYTRRQDDRIVRLRECRHCGYRRQTREVFK